MDIDAYAQRAKAFGEEVLTAAELGVERRPTVILAMTVKGRGFSEVEDSPDWHGKPFPPDMAKRAIAKLGGVRELVLRGPRPTGNPRAVTAAGNGLVRPAKTEPIKSDPPSYDLGQQVATRKAYGDALVALGARDDRVVALDGEVSNSTYAAEFAHAYPDRYFEMFIAEQQLVAAATGLAVRGYKPFASTFAAFLTRAYDFIRMGAISGVDIRLVGSHSGVEIGGRRSLPDGAGRPRHDACRTRLDRALPGRRDQHGRPGRADGHSWRNQLPAHHPRRLPGPLSDW